VRIPNGLLLRTYAQISTEILILPQRTVPCSPDLGCMACTLGTAEANRLLAAGCSEHLSF